MSQGALGIGHARCAVLSTMERSKASLMAPSRSRGALRGNQSHSLLPVRTQTGRAATKGRPWSVASPSRSTLKGGVRQPGQKPVKRPTVDDSFGGNTRKTRMGERGLGKRKLRGGVRIAVECEETPHPQGPGRQDVIEVLP